MNDYFRVTLTRTIVYVSPLDVSYYIITSQSVDLLPLLSVGHFHIWYPWKNASSVTGLTSPGFFFYSIALFLSIPPMSEII